MRSYNKALCGPAVVLFNQPNGSVIHIILSDISDKIHLARGRLPANTRRWNNDGLMLGQRRRRWPNIKSSLVQRLVFAWLVSHRMWWSPPSAKHPHRSTSRHPKPSLLKTNMSLTARARAVSLSRRERITDHNSLCDWSIHNDIYISIMQDT